MGCFFTEFLIVDRALGYFQASFSILRKEIRISMFNAYPGYWGALSHNRESRYALYIQSCS